MSWFKNKREPIDKELSALDCNNCVNKKDCAQVIFCGLKVRCKDYKLGECLQRQIDENKKEIESVDYSLRKAGSKHFDKTVQNEENIDILKRLLSYLQKKMQELNKDNVMLQKEHTNISFGLQRRIERLERDKRGKQEEPAQPEMSKKQLHDFAKTQSKGLPTKAKKRGKK